MSRLAIIEAVVTSWFRVPSAAAEGRGLHSGKDVPARKEPLNISEVGRKSSPCSARCS